MKCAASRTVIILLSLCLPAAGQWKEPPSTGSPTSRTSDRTTLTGQAGMGPWLTMRLVNPKNNAQSHKAIVEVQTDGVKIVNPIVVNHEPRLDEAHIQYRLDNGPIQNTTSKSWTFEHLSRGEHFIRVALASSDNRQLGREVSLKLKVP